MAELMRMTPADRDEVLYVMNTSFGQDFEHNLPIMWNDDDLYMPRHFGVREDGKLVAIIGVYPLPVRIAGRDLLFSTMGNVGTLPEYRGKGYMKQMLAASIEELARLDVDAARLGGQRQRYNRFGFDHGGINAGFNLTRKNISAKFGEIERTLEFRPLERADHEGIAFARMLHRRQGIYTIRETDDDFWLTLRAWDCFPYLVYESGTPVAYLSGNTDGTSVVEQGAVSTEIYSRMLREWLISHDAPRTSVRLSPWETAEIAELSSYCEGWNVYDTSMFRISHWDKVTEALLALALTFRDLPDGTARVGIEGFGTLEMSVSGGSAHCEMNDSAPEITLDRLAAVRMLFGPLPSYTFPLPRNSILHSWLPLPLAWNGQDRV